MQFLIMDAARGHTVIVNVEEVSSIVSGEHGSRVYMRDGEYIDVRQDIDDLARSFVDERDTKDLRFDD